MTAELLEKVADELATLFVNKAGPKLIEYLDKRRRAPEPDPLLSAQEAADELGVSHTTVRQLAAGGYIMRAPGIKEFKVRKSELDRYAKSDAQGRNGK